MSEVSKLFSKRARFESVNMTGAIFKHESNVQIHCNITIFIVTIIFIFEMAMESNTSLSGVNNSKNTILPSIHIWRVRQHWIDYMEYLRLWSWFDLFWIKWGASQVSQVGQIVI